MGTSTEILECAGEVRSRAVIQVVCVRPRLRFRGLCAEFHARVTRRKPTLTFVKPL